METFTKPKKLVENPNYQDQRQTSLTNLSDEMIDAPIIALIKGFNKISCCFTMQSCYGHFVYDDQKDPYNFEPLPIGVNIGRVQYRIAYICLCIENSDFGGGLLKTLNEITNIDPENIQFCCAEWFWNKQVNSYALQVQPERFKNKDSAILDFREALHIGPGVRPR